MIGHDRDAHRLIVTVLVALLTALLLLLGGYNGYAGLGLAVAFAAAINLL